MLTPVDFGPVKPSITTFYGGYRVPVALQQVDIPAGPDGLTAKGWRGYLLELAGLTEVEFDRAAAELPAGDYSQDRLAALTEAVRLQRAAAYPPVEEYVDGVVKDDAVQIAEYKAKCLAVKADHPMPWDASASYAAGDLVTHNGVKYRKLNDGDNSAPDDVPGGWEAV